MGPLPSDRNNSSPCADGQGPLGCPPDEFPAPPPPYPPPPSPASHGHSTFVTALIIAVPVLAFLALCLSIFIFVRRRRLRRRRREALLEAALTPAAPATFPDDGPGGEGEVVHHVWHIRTVGLDDAAIESITLTRYRAGGVLGASDCTICHGEFQDGELLRLLPKCAHAFHVQCIDTWLRAHVTCPLCRADVVMDTAAAPADAEQPPGADAADASAEQPGSNTRTMEQERHGQQANEQQELRVEIDQPDHSSSLDRPRQQIRHPGDRAQNFRRVASMDSPSPPTASGEEAPEDEQAGAEKQGTGGAVCCEVSPEPGHQLKRSLSASSQWTLLSRHCRTRSSLLPL